MSQNLIASSNKFESIENIVKKNIIKKVKCKNITITRGRNGSFSYVNSKYN